MRGKGEGSIYRRADGRWVAKLELGRGPDGKRRRREFYGRTRKEVLAKLDLARDVTRARREPLPARALRVTVSDLLDEWLRAIHREGSTIGSLTAAQYEVEANTRVRNQLGQLAAADLDDEKLSAWQDSLLDAGYAPRSVMKARTVVNAVILIARRRRLLNSNPLELVPAPQARRPSKRAISGVEAGRFLQAIAGHPWETLILADLLTGMRRGELLGWAWSDVDLEAGTLRIRQQVQRIPKGGGLQLVEPKTDSSDRVMPLPSVLVEQLRALHPTRQGDLVFTAPRGRPIEPRHFNRIFKQLINAAGLAPLTPHELRHSMATILQHLGVRPVVVSQLLGHADPSVTLRWYTHEVPDEHREAMARMDEYVRRLLDEHGGSGVKMAVKPPVEVAPQSETSQLR